MARSLLIAAVLMFKCAVSHAEPVSASGIVDSALSRPPVSTTTTSVSGVQESVLAEAPAKPVSRTGFKLIPLGNADLRGGWTSVNDGKGALGLVGSAMILPAVKLPGNAGLILPIYAFTGALSDRVIEESILFESRQTHLLSLGYKKAINTDWDVKASLDGDYALTQQTRDEKFGKGLYDYRDFGGRTAVVWGPKRNGKEEPVSLGFRMFSRKYPNYMSLAASNQQFLSAINPAAAAAVADKEKHPKDYTGYELSASGERWLSEDLKGRLEYTLALQPYTDRYLRTDQGLLSAKKRSDTINQFMGRIDWAGLETAVLWTSFECLSFGSNGSNYDSTQAVYPYTANFFQFYDLNWRNGISLQLPFGEELHPKLECGVGVGRRKYKSHAQDVAGQNLKADQADNLLSANLMLNIPINKMFGVVSGVNRQMVSSNNLNEKYVRYNYNVTGISLGMTAKF